MSFLSSALGGLTGGISGLFGSGSGLFGSQQKSVTDTQAPWTVQQPYLQNLFSGAQNAFGSGSLSQANPYISQAASQYASSANNPNGLVGQAQNQLGKTISGQYLTANSNPYLQGAVQQALDQVKANTSGVFNGDNFGSSANQEWLGKILANTALPYYSQNYQNERQNQLSAVGAAPSLQSANADQLANAGQLYQSQLDLPYTGLSRFGSLVGGGYGSQTTTPYYTNPLGSALGGALGGFALTKSPYGAVGGGLLGLLGSR